MINRPAAHGNPDSPDLLASLKTCPALAGCGAITPTNGDNCVIADFAGEIQQHLKSQRSLWCLEALVLLAAYAQKTKNERLAREMASCYQVIEAEITLPPLAEHCRRELSNLCFSLMFKSLLKPAEASTQEGHRQQSSPPLWLDGRYPVWATGVLCVLMLGRLAYAPASPIENPALFPLPQRWSRRSRHFPARSGNRRQDGTPALCPVKILSASETFCNRSLKRGGQRYVVAVVQGFHTRILLALSK
jgi:hypothetical protein